MRVQVARQCAVTLPGRGHPAARRKELFPGQGYDLPEECGPAVAELVAAGALTLVTERAEPAPVAEAAEPKARPAGRRAR